MKNYLISLNVSIDHSLNRGYMNPLLTLENDLLKSLDKRPGSRWFDLANSHNHIAVNATLCKMARDGKIKRVIHIGSGDTYFFSNGLTLELEPRAGNRFALVAYRKKKKVFVCVFSKGSTLNF